MTRWQQAFIWIVALLIIGACGLTAIMTYQGAVSGLNATLTAMNRESTDLRATTSALLTAASP